MGIKIYTLPLIIASMAHVLNGQTQTGPRHGKIVSCYLASWSIYHDEPVQFKVSNLDPSLCTHMVYSFAGIEDTTMTVKSLDPGLDKDGRFENEGYKGLVDLKIKYPHLKVTLAIGGYNEGSIKYSNMVSTPENRRKFIQSVLDFMALYKFDGIDMHWKHPATRDGRPADKANFIIFMKELKEAFKPHGYLLTCVVASFKYQNDVAYDFPELNKYVDYIHLLSFDYHGHWDRVVGANAPLNGLDNNDVLNVEYTINYLLARGISPNKLVLGLPFYGRAYILDDPEVEVIEFGRTPSKNPFAGPYTNDNGFIAYNEICMELTENDEKWTRFWHEQSSTPYVRNKERVIVYDNTRSLAIKVKKAMQYNLAGVLVWSVDSDDFKGVCERDIDYVSVSFSALHRFVQKFNRITRNPILQRLLKDLSVSDAQKLESMSSSTELANKNHLWMTESSPNYPLLRAVDASITLALEEKLIMVDVQEIMNDRPKEETSLNATANTITQHRTAVCYFCFI